MSGRVKCPIIGGTVASRTLGPLSANVGDHLIQREHITHTTGGTYVAKSSDPYPRAHKLAGRSSDGPGLAPQGNRPGKPASYNQSHQTSTASVLSPSSCEPQRTSPRCRQDQVRALHGLPLG